MPKMIEIISLCRLEQLKTLLQILAEQIDARPGARDMASLSRQYRETLREIEELEGGGVDDEIGILLESREADGKPGAVRPNRS